MAILNLLRKSDVNEEELSQVSEYRAVQAAGLGSVEELLVTEPEGEGGQVLVSHLPDQRLLLPAHLNWMWMTKYFRLRLSDKVCSGCFRFHKELREKL